MSRTDTLKSLEIILESFLERAVAIKEQRLSVLGGINRLDTIAREAHDGRDITDDIGGWFAEHSRWLNEPGLRLSDRNRIGEILGSIKAELGAGSSSSPASNKISREIDRWHQTVQSGTQRLTMKRGAEGQSSTDDVDTITLFSNMLRSLEALYADVRGRHKHIMSVLDDTLKSALTQKNKRALLLSGFMIYYLKQSGYKVEPYVRRLKEAEATIAGAQEHA